MDQRATDTLFKEMVRRIEDLQSRLSAKGQEASELSAQLNQCTRELNSCRRELGSAQHENAIMRNELEREATRAALLEQKTSRAEAAWRAAEGQLHGLGNQHSTMDSTLGLVHEQLESVKRELAERTKELADLHERHGGLLLATQGSAATTYVSTPTGSSPGGGSRIVEVLELKQKIQELESENRQLSIQLEAGKGGGGSTFTAPDHQNRWADTGFVFLSKEQELKRHQNQIEDLQANVELLHQRIEHQQGTLQEVDTLKERLSNILSEVQTHPIIILPHNLTALASNAVAGTGYPILGTQNLRNSNISGSPGGGAGVSADLQTIINALLADGDEAATMLMGRASLERAVEALGGADMEQVDLQLEDAVAGAMGQMQILVSRLGMIEVGHWEIEQGLAGLQAAQAHLGALKREMMAGRSSIAHLLLGEVVNLLDSPTSATSRLADKGTPPQNQTISYFSTTQPSPHSPGFGFASGSHQTTNPSGFMTAPPSPPYMTPTRGGLAPPRYGSHSITKAAEQQPSDVSKLFADISRCRQVSIELVAHAKTCEAIMSGLKESLPTWMLLRKAQLKAFFRKEVAQFRGALERQIADLSAELDETREYLTEREQQVAALQDQELQSGEEVEELQRQMNAMMRATDAHARQPLPPSLHSFPSINDRASVLTDNRYPRSSPTSLNSTMRPHHDGHMPHPPTMSRNMSQRASMEGSLPRAPDFADGQGYASPGQGGQRMAEEGGSLVSMISQGTTQGGSPYYSRRPSLNNHEVA